ncbi:MAG: SIS domain-containing protein [Spirosomataceae bacterium]
MSLATYLNDYITQQQAAFECIPLEQVEVLIQKFRKALAEDRQIFVFGNGGSAANASHFVTDLSKSASDAMGKRFRCMSLNDNVMWITALGNDYAYEDVYVRQLMNFAQPGDMVMALSVSGSSPNLVKAFEWAKQHHVETIALIGGKKGTLANISDFTIVIDSTHYGRVEDAQMTICHLICYAFIEGQVP